ncbi:hypothetical protein SAMN05428952_101443 [Nitrosomonas sp. Nm132]|jgi:hypothetical protein|nr:hypothetical protein SAMN05428952_101443 [Nitrosomonas sp. Nm132]
MLYIFTLIYTDIVDPIYNDLNYIGGKELLDGATFSFSDGFSLSLSWFNIIKVWRIRWKIFMCMPSIGNGGFDILPFVEYRVILDDHASGQEFGQKVLRHPRMEDVDVAR